MSTPEELQYYQEIFMKGFWTVSAFNLFGLMLRIFRRIPRKGVDVE